MTPLGAGSPARPTTATICRFVVNSPIGAVTIGADASGRLTELRVIAGTDGLADGADGADDAAAFDDPAVVVEGADGTPRATAVLERVAAQLDEYFAGARRVFSVPVAPQGTAFQHEVWDAVAAIPYGTTASYGRLAARIGRPRAARAVGHANGQNPVALVIPCHRVLGASGALTGYGGGLEAKRFLLRLEGADGGQPARLAGSR